MRITFEPEAIAEQLRGPEVADALRRSQIDAVATATSVERAGAEAERARLEAKYGADSVQARAAKRRGEQIDVEQRAVNADRARQRVGTLKTSPDVFSIYGRVLNASGEALPKMTVAAVDGTGVELAKTKSRDEGLFQLRVLVTPKKKAKKAEATTAEAEPFANAPIVRLRISNQQNEVLSFNDEEFDAIGDTVAYREIIVMVREHAEPKAKRARKKPRKSGR